MSTSTEKRRQREKDFPWASLDSPAVSLVLSPNSNDLDWIKVRIKGDKGEESNEICLRNCPLEDLGRFIRSLIARYNLYVDKLNATSEKCQMHQARKIEEN